MSLEELVKAMGGTVIGALLVSDNRRWMVLQWRNEAGKRYADPPVLYAKGQCCSTSWFEEVLGGQALIGREVRGAEWIEVTTAPAREPEEERDWEDDVFGLRLRTDMGVCEIRLRNDGGTNGYYSGEVMIMSGHEKDIKFSRDGIADLLLAKLEPITEDWSASGQ